MRKLLAALLAFGFMSVADAQVYKPGSGSGGGGITAGTTTTTGCGALGVLFNLAGVVGCDTGFTYTGGPTGGTIFTNAAISATGGLSTAASTAINFGNGINTGIYQASGASINFAIGGASRVAIVANGMSIGAANDLFLTRAAAAGFQLGNTDAAAPVAQTFSVQNVVAGTSNTAGADWIIRGSQSTGTGVGGKIKLQTALTGLTGSTVNATFPMITINPGAATTATVQFGDGTNFTTYDSCTGFTSSATGVIACTTSAMRFKDMFPSQALNLVGLDNLRTDIPWKYKDGAGYGLDPERVHVGLFADDVEKMDSRCVTREGGMVKDYEDRCVIAYLVADRQKMKAEIEDLKRRVR